MNKIETVDILVVGAGPAGLCAAIEAARLGASVTIIDENAKPGGQLFKQIHKFFGSSEHKAGVRGYDIGNELLNQTKQLGVEVKLRYPVYGIWEDGTALYGSDSGTCKLKAKKIILATGASENTIFFEGSTLPGVLTAGAAQTMINEHLVLPGKKVVMVGSGNVGLIVSYQLMQAGAQVVALIEASDSIGGYAVHAGKLRRAGVPIYLSHTINRTFGEDEVQGVEIVALDQNFKKIPGSEKTLDADTVCLAVGLTPMVELAALGGCKLTDIAVLGGAVVQHDEKMCTTNDLVYVAGDITGVEEASSAMEEGKLAGIAAATSLGYLTEAQAQEQIVPVQKRLDELRSGQFGQKRFDAKKLIVNRFYEEGKSDGQQ